MKYQRYNKAADRGDPFMQTSQIITTLRNKAGLSQSQLADALFVTRDLVSKWETGKRLPEFKMILDIAKLFSVEPETLIDKNSILTNELSSLLPDGYPSDCETLKRDLNLFLGTLRERDRSVFIRRYYFFEDPNQIGEEYGIRANYVRTILTRTRRKLQKYLKEEYS